LKKFQLKPRPPPRRQPPAQHRAFNVYGCFYDSILLFFLFKVCGSLRHQNGNNRTYRLVLPEESLRLVA
jgi:hypothetical protein